MDIIISYILKVNIAIIVLYGLYCLCMDKDTFFNVKRAFLLAIFAFALCYPFMDYSFNWGVAVERAGHILTEKITIFILPENIAPAQTMDESFAVNTKLNWFSAIYLIGVILFISRIIFQLTGIAANIRKSRTVYLFGKRVYISEQPTNPYSFFGYIIMDKNVIAENELQEILRHEETHIKQWHSVDVILSQIMVAFCWFNPFVWLMNREIRMNLEFLADRSVLKSGYEPEHYQAHILRLSYHKAAARLYNNFSFSPLKNRIKMMNKKKTPGIYFLKYILIAPAVLTLLLLNSSFKAEETGFIKTDSMPVTGITEQQTAIADTVKSKPAEPEEIYILVDQMPTFNGGGFEKAREYVYKNLRYPQEARENNIQGTVRLSFVVDKTGKVKNVIIVRSSGNKSLDEEAVRVVESMPEWTPGKNKGKPANVRWQILVQFSLN